MQNVNDDMVFIEGYWWPVDVGQQYTFSLRRIKSLLASIRWCERRERTNTVVQAGGSVGVWPRICAKYFKQVHTFEPEPISFQCLDRNVTEPNVTKYEMALGAGMNLVGINKKKLTSHQVVHGVGNIRMVNIDGMKLDNCDAILLDVEGYEYLALLGAAETLKKFKPLVLVEARTKFDKEDQSVAEFLGALGYRKKWANIGSDDIYVHQ